MRFPKRKVFGEFHAFSVVRKSIYILIGYSRGTMFSYLWAVQIWEWNGWEMVVLSVWASQVESLNENKFLASKHKILKKMWTICTFDYTYQLSKQCFFLFWYTLAVYLYIYFNCVNISRTGTPCSGHVWDLSFYDLIYTDIRGLNSLKTQHQLDRVRYVALSTLITCATTSEIVKRRKCW